MAEELEKTCENCEYENEDMEGTHCRHCIHNAEEHFEPKTCYAKEQEIRNKAIDDFAEQIRVHYALRQELGYSVDTYEGIIKNVFEYAEKLKGGAE